MAILFYDHLVDKHEVVYYIQNLDEPENKKGKMLQLVNDIIHQGLMEYILQKLHPHKHRLFLTRLEDTPYDPELIGFLKVHLSPTVEDDLRVEANKLIKLIKKDLRI